jgi:predicted phosphodiesterase
VRLGVIADIHGNELARLLAGCGAEVVLGGHTHHQADRRAGGVRALNPGSAGQPRPAGRASWLLLEDGGHGGRPELTAQFRAVPFDVAAVVRDLQRRRHPNAAFVESVLDGRG